MVTCEFLQENMDLYLSGKLDATVTAQIEAHMAQCPECRRNVEEHRILLQELKKLPVANPSRELEERLRVGLRREVTRRQRRRVAYLRWGAGGVVIAAALAIAFIIPSPLNLRNLPSHSEAPSTLSASFAAPEEKSKDMVMGMAQGGMATDESNSMLQTPDTAVEESLVEETWAVTVKVTLQGADLSLIQQQAEKWSASQVEQGEEGDAAPELILDVPAENCEAFLKYLRATEGISAIESTEENIGLVYTQQQVVLQQCQQDLNTLKQKSGADAEQKRQETQDRAMAAAKTLDDLLHRMQFVQVQFVTG